MNDIPTIDVYKLRIDTCSDWPQMQMVLNETARVLDWGEDAEVREYAKRRIARLNSETVGRQQPRWF